MIQEYAKWLDDEPWDYFATLTVGYKMSLDRWRYRIEEVFHPKLTYQEQNSVIFWVAEKFKSGDNFHAHALIKSNLPAKIIYDIWQISTVYKGQRSFREDKKVFNRCTIEKRIPGKRAGSYIMKDVGYCTKELFDYAYGICI